MQRKMCLLGRITPWVLLAGLCTQPVFAESLGHWSFLDDGTGVELRPCTIGAAAQCGVITRLPKSAATLSVEERRAVCGITLLSDLQPAKAKDGEQARLEGSVIDIDSMTSKGKASQYDASFIVLSETRARLDVKGAFGIVFERLLLIRSLAAPPACK